ncbi:MAG: hypothetical protein FGM16_07640 [Flavobacterium sp.]|nr:hypothetical protein [Flavobacterium sp.]
MPRMLYDYTRTKLEQVSFDQALFCKELRKASKSLLPYEIEQLHKWLQNFTNHKPELQQYLQLVK